MTRSPLLLVSSIAFCALPLSAATRSPDTEIGHGKMRHPVTAEHLRLYRDVDLLDAARRAIATHRFAEARALLSRHRAEFAPHRGDDESAVRVLLDCVEHPGAATRAGALRFYRTETHSMLRRTIRRVCSLDP